MLIDNSRTYSELLDYFETLDREVQENGHVMVLNPDASIVSCQLNFINTELSASADGLKIAPWSNWGKLKRTLSGTRVFSTIPSRTYLAITYGVDCGRQPKFNAAYITKPFIKNWMRFLRSVPPIYLLQEIMFYDIARSSFANFRGMGVNLAGSNRIALAAHKAEFSYRGTVNTDPEVANQAIRDFVGRNPDWLPIEYEKSFLFMINGQNLLSDDSFFPSTAFMDERHPIDVDLEMFP